MEYDVTEEEAEKLYFTWLYSIDLNTAQHILKTVSRHTSVGDQDKSLRYYMLMALVVTYMRPFSVNYGTVIEKDSLRQNDLVPPEYMGLHDRIKNYRNQQFAHTDVEYFKPRMGNLGTIDQPHWTLSFRGSEFEFLDKNLQRIGELIGIVEARVNALLAEKLAYLNSKAARTP